MTAVGRPLRAFLSHSARTGAALEPIVERTEALLHDFGWRTRLPRRPEPGSVALSERRRLREEAYLEIERCDAVLHVPAPASLAGTLLNRELQRAVRLARPILLLVFSDLRDVHGIGLPDPDRLRQLVEETRGRALLSFEELAPLIRNWPEEPA